MVIALPSWDTTLAVAEDVERNTIKERKIRSLGVAIIVIGVMIRASERLQGFIDWSMKWTRKSVSFPR